MEYIKSICVDLSGKGLFDYITAVQGDSARGIRVKIVANNQQYIPETGASAILRVRKPDGTYILQDGTIENDGTIKAMFTGQATAAAGYCRCELAIYGANGGVITTTKFVLRVSPASLAPAIDSTNEYQALENAITDVKKSSGVAQAALETATEALEKTNEVETEIATHIAAAELATATANTAATNAETVTNAAIDATDRANAAANAADNTTAGEHITADLSGTETVIAAADVYRDTVSVNRTDNDITSFDGVAVESDAAIVVNGVTYDLSDDSKADTYSIDFGTGKVTHHKAITVAKTGIADEWTASAGNDGTYELSRADAVAGTGYCSDPDTAVTSVDGKISAKRTATDGKNFAARLAEIDASKNRFGVFEPLGDTTKKGVALSLQSGKEGTTVETSGAFTRTSDLIAIPERYRDGTSKLYINYYDSVAQKRGRSRVSRVCFYSDDYDSGSPATGTYSFALSESTDCTTNGMDCFAIPQGMTGVRFSVYIGDRITPANAANWSAVESIQLSDFRVCFSSATEDLPDIKIAYPTSINIVLSDTFTPKDQNTISATGTQYRAQYDKRHLLKEDVALHAQKIERLEVDSPRTITGQLFGDLLSPAIHRIDKAHIQRGDNVAIVSPTGEPAGRRLYFMEAAPGKEYSIYSESGKTIVIAAVEAANETVVAAGYNAKANNLAYKDASNITASGVLCRSAQLTVPEPKNTANKMYLVVQVTTTTDYPTTSVDDWYRAVFAAVTVEQGPPRGVVRASRIIPHEMLEDDLIHEPYRSLGEKYAVAKADRILNVRWTPMYAGMKMAKQQNADPTKYVDPDDFTPGKEQVGLPYSSVKALNQFIGIDVLLETFMSALKNPNSVLYNYNAQKVNAVNHYLSATASNGFYAAGSAKKESSQRIELACCYYGIVCTSFTGYCIGQQTYETTYSLPHAPGIEAETDRSAYGCHRGSIILGQHYRTGGGHASLVTDVERSKDGDIRFVDTAESTLPVTKSHKAEPAQLFDNILSFSRNGEYTKSTIYRYAGLDRNIVCEFDIRVLDGRGGKSDANVIVLDDRFDRIGCVYYILDTSSSRICVPIYEGASDNDSLHWEYVPKANNSCALPLLRIAGKLDGTNIESVSEGRIAVSPIDTMRSHIVPEWAYNLRNDIGLDRGNRSSYRKGEAIKVSNLSGSAVNIIIKNADTGTVWQDEAQSIGQNTIVKGNASVTGYTTIAAGQHLVIDTSGIPAGYYTVATDDETRKPLEFLAYDTGTVYVSVDSFIDNDDGKVIAEHITGKVASPVMTANKFVIMTPLYVSLTTDVGVVGNTSTKVAVSGGNVNFAINKYALPDGYNNSGKTFNCIRVHFETRFGRVITEPTVLKLYPEGE